MVVFLLLVIIGLLSGHWWPLVLWFVLYLIALCIDD